MASKDLSAIAPGNLYPLRGFYAVSGISPTRVREAKRHHAIELETIDVGKRKFVEGERGIQYIKALAALPKQSN